MPYLLKDLAASLGAQTLGDASLLVDRLAEPAEARAGDLALAVAPKFAGQLTASKARAAVVWAEADLDALGLDGAIVAPRGRLAMAGLTRAMDDDPTFAGGAGVHPTAVIDPAADVAEGAQIGPLVVVSAGARIGPQARIAAHVWVGPEARIGARVRLFPGVKIGARVRIGDDFTAQAGAAIGGDGFSFTTAGPSNVERAVRARPGVPLDPMDGTWHRIHSLGSVEIGNDVEIGGNVVVDAGTVRATRIGNGVKIDNLVQVGHNVVIGEDCLICAQTGIAGSTVLGARCILGGKAGVADNLTLGRDVVVAGAGKVFADVPDGTFVSGHPAQPTHLYRAGIKALRRLIKG